MALRTDTLVTAELADEARRVIDAIPEAELMEFAQSDPAFQSGGFRTTRVAHLRARVFQLVTAPQPIAESLRRLLARHSLNLRLVALLTPATLAENRQDLAVLFGSQRLLLALLVDEREGVREMAERWLREGGAASLPIAPDAAAARLRERFGPLLARLAAAGVETPADPADGGREREDLRERLRVAQTDVRRLRTAEERRQRAQEHLDAQAQELAALRRQFDAAEIARRQSERLLADLEAELARERNQTEARVQARVETRLATEFHGWLARQRHVAAEAVPAAAAAGQDLLQRAAAALARQAAEDAASGTYAGLRARLTALTGQHVRVQAALANAVHPVAALIASAGELAREVARLRELLDGDTPPDRVAEALLSAAAGADVVRLVALRSLAQEMAGLNLLLPRDAARLQDALRLRQALLQATTPPAALSSHGDKDADPDNALWRLRQALQGAATAIVLVDGHNTLFSLQARYFASPTHSQPNAAARERLVTDWVRVVADRPTARVWIVFDGPEASERSAAENVRVSYSGGTGTDRADAVLAQTVRFFRQAGAQTIILVSNDGALVAEACRLGALVLPPGNLLTLLT